MLHRIAKFGSAYDYSAWNTPHWSIVKAKFQVHAFDSDRKD